MKSAPPSTREETRAHALELARDGLGPRVARLLDRMLAEPELFEELVTISTLFFVTLDKAGEIAERLGLRLEERAKNAVSMVLIGRCMEDHHQRSFVAGIEASSVAEVCAHRRALARKSAETRDELIKAYELESVAGVFLAAETLFSQKRRRDPQIRLLAKEIVALEQERLVRHHALNEVICREEGWPDESVSGPTLSFLEMSAALFSEAEQYNRCLKRGFIAAGLLSSEEASDTRKA